MSARAVLSELLTRVDRHRELEALIASEFEFVDNHRIAIRRDDVVRFVSDSQANIFKSVTVTNRLRRDVLFVVQKMGGFPTRMQNKRIFRRFKRVSTSVEDALEQSKELVT